MSDRRRRWAPQKSAGEKRWGRVPGKSAGEECRNALSNSTLSSYLNQQAPLGYLVARTDMHRHNLTADMAL